MTSGAYNSFYILKCVHGNCLTTFDLLICIKYSETQY